MSEQPGQPGPGPGFPADPVTMLAATAGMHHEWYLAWLAAGFTAAQAENFVQTIIRAAFQPGLPVSYVALPV